jgi:hypothetical protein
MARTHGTRSAYNAGCRCDACREATRVARARQRAGSGWEPSAAVPESADYDVAPPGLGWALAGVVTVGAGGYALWHGATMDTQEDSDPEAVRRRRKRWLLAGGVLVVFGIVAIRHAS